MLKLFVCVSCEREPVTFLHHRAEQRRTQMRQQEQITVAYRLNTVG